MPNQVVSDPFSRASLRQALNNWSNVIKLGQHPLTQTNIVYHHHQKLRRPNTPPLLGLSLREVLRAAIDQMGNGPETNQRNKKLYRLRQILVQEFVHGEEPYAVALSLNMPERTYQENRALALEELASILIEIEDTLDRNSRAGHLP